MKKYKKTSFLVATIFSVTMFLSIIMVEVVIIKLFHISPFHLAILIESVALFVMLCIFFSLNVIFSQKGLMNRFRNFLWRKRNERYNK